MKEEIRCPHCGNTFNAENALSAHLEEKIKKEYQEKLHRFTADMSAKQNAFQEQIQVFQAQKEKFEETKKQENEVFQERLSQRLKEEALKIEQKVKEELNEQSKVQLQVLQAENVKKNEELTLLRKKEVDFLRQKQQIEDEKAQIDLITEKRLLEGRKEIEDRVTKRLTESHSLREKEFQKQLNDQKQLIEEMKRKSEQGSMQMQGEVQELLIEEELKAMFPFDEINEVSKGVKGADCIQLVRNQYGKIAGKIMYESKRTKNFSNEWIEKLKADQRSEGADVCVLITQVMPKELNHFGQLNGVWICAFNEYKALASVLRDGLIKVEQAQASQENKGDKMALLYNFLTGSEFRHQVEAIVEAFSTLKADLDKEKRAMQRIWKEREKQIEKVFGSTVDMYASVRGIAGGAVQEIKALELGAHLENTEDEI
jgi:hypothetical protein